MKKKVKKKLQEKSIKVLRKKLQFHLNKLKVKDLWE